MALYDYSRNRRKKTQGNDRQETVELDSNTEEQSSDDSLPAPEIDLPVLEPELKAINVIPDDHVADETVHYLTLT